MRKQYHFRPSENGLNAWCIDHLVDLTKNITVKEVSLSSIKELDGNYWFAYEGQVSSCRAVVEHCKLMSESDLNYPIILSSNGRVMDGMHRVCKALLEGRENIKAVKFNIDPEPDYRNIQHPDDLPY